MAWIDRGRDVLRRWFRRGAEERALADEFAFHLEQETARRVSEGLLPEDAARAARLSFGAAERHREEARDTWTPRLDGLAADLRWGVRRLHHAGLLPGRATLASASAQHRSTDSSGVSSCSRCRTPIPIVW
jgi:hypothetical protein